MPNPDAEISITDSVGITRRAAVLFAGAEQINFVAPDGLAPGPVQIAVRNGSGLLTSTATGEVQRVAPGLFTANASGRGVAAATAFRMESDGSQTSIPVFRCNAQLACAAERLEIEQGRPIYLSLYATGVRGGRRFV